MDFNEFNEWDLDNGSAKIIVGLSEKDLSSFDCEDILGHYGLEKWENGETQNYVYSSSISNLKLIENKFTFEIFENQFSSIGEFIGEMEKYSFDHFWFYKENSFNFVSDYYWEDNENLIETVLSESKYFAVCEVCVVSD